MWVFIVSLLTTAKLGLTVDKWPNKLWQIQVMGYYLILKSKLAWRSLKFPLLSE